jgi:alginate O-acetyltransferase complex protein AlgI
VPSPRARRLILLACCVVFHAHFAGPAGVAPIALLGALTYLLALTRRRAACLAGIAACAAALVFYKYTRFLWLDVVGPVWPALGRGVFRRLDPLLPGLPPLAISFFVFEFVHYLSEVARGAPPLRKPLDFGLFALFWPSIVAGPVKRYEQFVPALREGAAAVSRHDVAVGTLLVSLGLVKKLVADILSAVLADRVPHLEGLPPLDRWGLFLAVGLRILWDFSGYSDLAIGFARMLGVRLPLNFDWPYLAPSLTEFWRRWHVSLSLWIRDYVYIPLGGSRRGVARKACNGLLAFALCGLWHGAAWNFLFWGLYHGAGLAVCSSYRTLLGRPGELLGRWLARDRLTSWALTMLFVHVGWLFFFYPLPRAWRILALLFQGAPA